MKITKENIHKIPFQDQIIQLTDDHLFDIEFPTTEEFRNETNEVKSLFFQVYCYDYLLHLISFIEYNQHLLVHSVDDTDNRHYYFDDFVDKCELYRKQYLTKIDSEFNKTLESLEYVFYEIQNLYSSIQPCRRIHIPEPYRYRYSEEENDELVLKEFLEEEDKKLRIIRQRTMIKFLQKSKVNIHKYLKEYPHCDEKNSRDYKEKKNNKTNKS